MDIDDSSSLSSLSDHEDDPLAPPPQQRPATASPAAADASEDGRSNRRRSTRVVKKVQVYSAEPVPSTRKPKRKRAPADDSDAENQSTSPGTIQGDDDEDNNNNNNNNEGEESQEEEEEGEDDDDEDESASEDEESDSSEGEPDEEELKELRRKNKRAAAPRGGGAKRGRGGRPAAGTTRKPVAKKVKTVTGEATPATPTAEPRKKATKPPRKRATNGDVPVVPPMVNGLYASVFNSNTKHDAVANDWVKKYQLNGADGMKEMINFILKCCGCDNEVTNYDIEDQDSASTTLSQIQDAFQQQQTAEYPLTSKKAIFRKFRQQLSSFIEALISTTVSQGLVTKDPALMENMQVWITAMSSSTLRQFRHTATVIALDMVSHLAQNAADIRKFNGNMNRQLEAENSRATKNDGRIEDMSEKIKAGEEKLEVIESIINDLFDTVFRHRYRDIDPKIRIDCIHELSNWITVLPDIFLDGTYIRYMGWVLSDTQAATRLEVVKALTKIFRKKDQASGLRHFTERFKARLVEMATRDADTVVRGCTVELLDAVREVGYLEPTDIETVGRLLFDSEQKVRRAVVGFFVENINDLYQEKLQELGGEETVQEALGGDEEDEEYEGPTLAWIKIKCLVEALAAYDQSEAGEEAESQNLLTEKNSSIVMKVGEVVSRFSLAGAVLWDTLDEVRDWEGLARYLLYDHSASRAEGEDAGNEEDVEKQVKKTVALDAKEDVILLQVLNASVAGSIVKGPDPPNKKKPQVRTAKEIEKHKENVSRSLMIFIPLLLKKFGPVPDAASSVLRLEQLMNLDVFQELRQSAAYSSLLDEINRQFLTHADEGVLKEASAALMHAKTFEDLEEVTELKLGQLKEETVNALGNAVRGKDLATAKFSDANLTELINTVRRLEHLSGITDCVETLDTPIASTGTQDDLKPVDVLLELLNRGTTNDELVEELTLRVLRTLSFYFMWKVRGFNNAGNSADSAELDEMIERRKSAFERITTVLTERADVDPVKISAAITLLELTTLFISSSVPSLASLQGPLDVPTQAQIMSVFDAVEKSFAKGTGRKLEPDENAEPEDDEEAERAEGEDLADESSQLMLEQRLCEFASKIVLAAFAHVVDVKLWKKRLARNQPRLGANYKEVVNFLDRANIGRAGTRRGPQKKAPAQPRQQTNQKSAEKVVEDEEEEEDHESQADADEHHDDEEEEEEEHGDGEQHDDGAETVVPADEDEEMMDA